MLLSADFWVGYGNSSASFHLTTLTLKINLLLAVLIIHKIRNCNVNAFGKSLLTTVDRVVAALAVGGMLITLFVCLTGETGRTVFGTLMGGSESLRMMRDAASSDSVGLIVGDFLGVRLWARGRSAAAADGVPVSVGTIEAVADAAILLVGEVRELAGDDHSDDVDMMGAEVIFATRPVVGRDSEEDGIDIGIMNAGDGVVVVAAEDKIDTAAKEPLISPRGADKSPANAC